MSATITYLQTAETGTDASTYTFSAQNIGTASSDRYIMVAIGSRKSGASAHVTSVTVGGVTATSIVDNPSYSSNTGYSGLFMANVTSGTTGDIVITFSGTMVRCSISLYSLTGINPTVYSTLAVHNTTTPSGSLSVTSGGVTVGAFSNAQNNAVTWSGITTKDYDGNTTGESTYRFSSASGTESSAATNTISVTGSGITVESSMSAAHFQAASTGGGGSGASLVGVGTNASGSADILAVYISTTNLSGTSAAPPYNVVVTYSGETLSTQTYGGAWTRLAAPSAGWTWSALQNLQVSGDQYGSYSTAWTDTNILVITKFSTSNSNFLFFFNGL